MQLFSFRYESTGESLVFTKWLEGEPNSNGGDEDHVEFFAGIGKMNDAPADTERTHSVCVTTPSTSSSTETISTNQQLCHEIKSLISVAEGSSVDSNIVDYGAHLAIDDLVSEQDVGFFKSNGDFYAWLLLDFSTTMTIEALSVVMRYDCCADQFNDVGIYVGNEPATYGQLSRNQKCTFYEGPAQNGEIVELTCDVPVSGKNVIIQKVDWSYERIMVNEVSVCGYEGILRDFFNERDQNRVSKNASKVQQMARRAYIWSGAGGALYNCT